MNALFALALLVSPSQAGVVMSVENGVAPAGPSMTAVVVGPAAGGLIAAPSFGAGLDLRGGLPLLPSPVPGLYGSPALNFVGNAPEAVAVQPAPGAAQVKPSPVTAVPGRAADKTPALPAKIASGAVSLAISRDRKSAASTPDNGLSLPLVDPAMIEHAQPEKTAGLGRSFFDQSNDQGRGGLADAAAADQPSPVVAATLLEGGAFGPGYGATGRLAPRDAIVAFGAGHVSSQKTPSYAPEGETLHDAVASAPPGSVAPAGAVAFFGSAAPNGDLVGAHVGAHGSAVLPIPGAPRPLALDLSRSGLIVRVRSALAGVMGAPAESAASAPKLVMPGSSTALLERGAMFEAFSVAQAYADGAAAKSLARPLAAGVWKAAAPAVPPAPAGEASPTSLWWAWFVIPLVVAVVRVS